MNTTNAKIELAKLVLELEDPDVIEKLYELIMGERSDFWVELSNEEREEIKLGVAQLDKGEKVSFKRYMNNFR